MSVIHHYLPTILLHQQTEVSNLVTRRSCNIKKYIFKNLINIPAVNTRLNKAVIFKTERPNIAKYESNPLYRGATTWNSLKPEIRNI